MSERKTLCDLGMVTVDWPSPVGPLRQLRTHSVQGAVRIHETELSHSIVRVTCLTDTTLDSTIGLFRSDGIGI